MGRVEPPAVDVAVLSAGRLDVLVAVGGRVHRGEVVDDADLGVGSGGADRLRGQAVAQQQVVRGTDGGRQIGPARGHLAFEVADPGRAGRLVEGGPVGDAVAEAFGHDRGVGGEVLGRLALGPAAAVLEGLGQVPVVEGDGGGDARLQEAVHQLVVEREALGVDRAVAAGEHPGPGDGQPVGVGAELAHQADVLAPAVVVVAGDVAVVVVRDLSGVCEKVSQIDGERPSSVTAPSIWYAAVAVPHRKSCGSAAKSMVTEVPSQSAELVGSVT